MLLRCERSDNRFKARVAPQRIPEGMEAQIAVSNMAPWQLHYLSQSFNCAILVARPRINDREILNHPRAIDGVFADGDQVDRALAFADGILFISQSSINDTDRAKSRCIIGLLAHDLLKFSSSAGKRGTSCLFVPAKPPDKAAAPTVGEWDVFVVAAAYRHRCEYALGGSRVALAKGKVEPLQNDIRRRLWVLGEGGFNCRVQRARIGTPLKFNPGAPHFDRNVFWRYGQHFIKSRDRFFVAPQGLVSKGRLLKYGKIVRVQFQRLLHLIEGFVPAPLPSINVGC